MLLYAQVLMTLANEINCRKLDGEANVFAGIFDNVWFVAVLIATLVLQVLCVEFGGFFLKCYIGGLDAHEWAFCLLSALFVLVWQQVVNAVAWFFGDVDEKTPYSSAEGGMFKFKSCFGNGNVEFAHASLDSSVRAEKKRKASLRVSRSGSLSSLPSTPSGRG